MMHRGTLRYLSDSRGNRLYYGSPGAGYQAAAARMASLNANQTGAAPEHRPAMQPLSAGFSPTTVQPVNASFDRPMIPPRVESFNQPAGQGVGPMPARPAASLATYPTMPAAPGAPAQPVMRPVQQAALPPIGYVPAMLTRTFGLEGLHGITPAQRVQLLNQFYGRNQNTA